MNVGALLDLARTYTPDDLTITGIDADQVVQRLTSMPANRSMLGTSTLTLVLADCLDGRRYELLNGPRALELWDDDGLLRGDITLDVHDPGGDLGFTLHSVEKTDDGLELTFRDALVSALMGEHGSLTAQRDTMTRAAFVESLCRRAGVPAFVPERNIEQPIKDFSKDDRKTIRSADRVERKDRSRPAEPLPRDPKLVQTGEVTLQSWARSFLTALDAPLTARNVKAVVGWELAEGGHWVNDARFNPLNTTENRGAVGDTGTQGNISVYPSWEVGLEATLKTVRDGWDAHGYGRVVEALRDGASLSAIAKAISDSDWMPGAYPNLLAAMQGASPDGGGRDLTAVRGQAESYDVAVIERYEFRVGRDENYLQAGRRFADEVRFRFFSTLSQMVYASDPALASQPVSMRIREGDDGVDRIRWHATRRRRVDELRVTARTMPWAAPPGAVVDVLGERPRPKARKDGSEWPWLVRDIGRDLMDPTGEASIRLGQPQKPRKEPAPEVRSKSVGGRSWPTTTTARGGVPKGTPEPIAKAYAEAVRIHNLRDPYVYGGGHYRDGYDCSGYVSAVLIAGDMLDGVTDTVGLGGWGSPGEGRYLTIWVRPYSGMNGHTFMEFNLPGKDTEWFEAGGGIEINGRRDSMSTAGYQPRRPDLGT